VKRRWPICVHIGEVRAHRRGEPHVETARS
jgi:hypothetical protein